MQGHVLCNWNESNLKTSTSINWRASLVPAAAVIPAPIAYIKVVAVKKLVVGLVCMGTRGLRPKGRYDMRFLCRKIFNWIAPGLD